MHVCTNLSSDDSFIQLCKHTTCAAAQSDYLCNYPSRPARLCVNPGLMSGGCPEFRWEGSPQPSKMTNKSQKGSQNFFFSGTLWQQIVYFFCPKKLPKIKLKCPNVSNCLLLFGFPGVTLEVGVTCQPVKQSFSSWLTPPPQGSPQDSPRGSWCFSPRFQTWKTRYLFK